MNLETITDINQLKIMKSDWYDMLNAAQQQGQQAQQNIQNLNTRIAQLQAADSRVSIHAPVAEDSTATE